MSIIRALIIAVENYQDSNICSVAFAENDAIEFSKALIKSIDHVDNIELLVNEKATKTAIESKLRTCASSLNLDDEFMLYYAGHGFSNNGYNYITCVDTVLLQGELVKTSIELKSIFKEIRDSKCTKAVFFLDSCHSGLEIDCSMRSLISKMNNKEYEDFCRESEYYVTFSACSSAESSKSSSQLKHGIWTHHLIAAFNGNAHDALERGRYLSSSSLQNYLSSEVPRTLRKLKNGKDKQTPTIWGNMSRDFILADLQILFAKRNAEMSLDIMVFEDFILRHTKRDSVRSLSGFKPGHFVPKFISSATRKFVKGSGISELSTASTNVYEHVKKEFNYKRKDLNLSEDINDGVSTLITPDFNCTVFLDIDEDDPSKYIFGIEISNIQNKNIILDEGFAKVFDNHFDELEFSLKGSVNIEDVVDTLEEHKNEDLFSINYPQDLSYLELILNDKEYCIRFENNLIKIVFNKKTQIKKIIECCKDLPVLFFQIGLMPHLLM